MLGTHVADRQGCHAQWCRQPQPRVHASLGRSIVFLDSVIVCQARARSSERHLRLLRGRVARTDRQPVLLHDRVEHHVALQCQHRDHVAAHLRHDSLGHNPEGAHHRSQGPRRVHRLLGRAHPHPGKCRRPRLARWRHTWRRDVHLRPAFFRPISRPLPRLPAPLFAHHREQVDVHVGRAAHVAIPRAPRRANPMARRAGQGLGGGGLRGAVRHVRSLFAHAESPKHIAPHGGERLQLCATCGVGER